MPTQKFRIEVTQEDIAAAERNNSRACAVSTAIERCIPECIHVSTDIQTIRFSLPSIRRRLVFLTPDEVQNYVVSFDAGDAIQPFTFTLWKPAWNAPMQISIPSDVRTLTPEESAGLDTLISYRVNEPDKNSSEKHDVRTRKGQATFPRRVTKDRYYGRRVMRVNQAKTD